MQCKHYSAWLAAISCATLALIPTDASAQTHIAAPAASSGTNISTDGPVRLGRLENGLEYAIVPRKSNDPGVALLIRVKGGFLAEKRPGERGLAHLIEHLIFRSPTQAAPDDRFRFRTIGMPLTLEAPAGGTTLWRESDYFVVAKTNKVSDFDPLLSLFHEVMSGLVFRADIVDEQRGDVMREMADKKQGNAIYAHYIKAVAPGSPTDIIDAQNSDDVQTANLNEIRALYQRLYRPENTSIIIVGDVNAVQIEELIAKRFGDWQGTGGSPDRAAIPEFQRKRIAPISYSAQEGGRSSVMITLASPLPRRAMTRQENAQSRLMDMVAMRAISNRLARSQASGSPGKYGIFIENGEQGHRLIMLWDNFEQGQWQSALGGLEKTACDVHVTGLSAQEWNEAKAFILQDLRARAAGMSNFDVARQVTDDLTIRRSVMPPAELSHYAESWLPGVDVAKGNRWWREQWRRGTQHIRVEASSLTQDDAPLAAIRDVAEAASGNSRCRVRER